MMSRFKNSLWSKGLIPFNFQDDNNEEPCLDAKFIDVYKSAHGVILVYDITKQW